MRNNPLIEMSMLGSAKETENKLRWDADIEGTPFSLYIPKWRVPQPWPSRIWIGVTPRRFECDELPNLSRENADSDSSLTHEPLIATVAKYSEHSRTIRYRPLGDDRLWEIGEPYVPLPLTFGGADRLRLLVLWDLASRGMFQSRVTNLS